MIKLIGTLVVVAVILMSISFCLGLFFGYNRAIDEVMGYSIERTIIEIGKIFERHGMKDIFDRLIKEETELKREEKTDK